MWFYMFNFVNANENGEKAHSLVCITLKQL